MLGSLVAAALQLRPEIAGGRNGALATGLSLVVIAATFGYLLPTTVPEGSAQVVLRDVRSGPDRTVEATVRFSPADVAENADWLTATAWQGGDKLVVNHLRRIREGVYRTTEPLPVTGSWKSAIRYHRGSEMASIPVYLPEDKAIPAAGIPASAEFTRTLTSDHELLQRERKDDVPGWLFASAGSVVLLFWLVLIAAFAWGLARIAGLGAPLRPSSPPATAPPAPARRPELARA